MKTITEHLREHLLTALGILSREPMPPLETLQQTEWSEEFEGHMRRRLILGAFRHGRLGDPKKPTFDRLADIVRRIERYRKTRNKEMLVDIANVALLEFVEGDGHFSAGDDGEHCPIKE